MTSSFKGKPPKSVDRIRSSLESIHKTAEVNNESGPLIGGFGPEHPFKVGSFYSREVARDFQQKLNQSGVFSKLVVGRQATIVTVDHEDRQRAAALFQQHRRQHPNLRPKGNARRFDFLIFGVVITMTLSFILLADEWDHPLALTIPLTFCAIGASLGHVFDRVRMGYWQTGRLRIGIWEFMVLAAQPAIIALAWKSLPEILFK